jgi:hypothetical protein
MPKAQIAPPLDSSARPLVAPEVDLRDFPFVPVYRQRLLTSRFNHLASDAEWRAGFTLWLASWDQVPAGSLPSDDRELCQLAGLGRDMRQWRKVKKWALYHWASAVDGRLYHPVVAEMVNNAWSQKQANRHRTSAASEARRKHRNDYRDGDRDDRVAITKAKREGEQVELPERKESQSPARVNGHAREGEKINDVGPLGSLRSPGRSAPLGGVKGQKKELLRQKVMRFAHATMNADARQAAFIGILGEDAEHSAQWWLDTLDQAMRKARWDDAP